MRGNLNFEGKFHIGISNKFLYLRKTFSFNLHGKYEASHVGLYRIILPLSNDPVMKFRLLQLSHQLLGDVFIFSNIT